MDSTFTEEGVTITGTKEEEEEEEEEEGLKVLLDFEKKKNSTLVDETERIKNSMNDFLLVILHLEKQKTAALIKELDRIKGELFDKQCITR